MAKTQGITGKESGEMNMNEKKMRIIMALVGVTICGIGIAFCKSALFGTDPFQCLTAGVVNISGIGYGTIYMMMNVVMLIAMFVLAKHYIGIATLANIFIMGYMVEFFMYLLEIGFGEVGLIGRIVYLAIGIVTLCFSLAMYFTADLGVSPYDFIGLYLEERGVGQFRFCRIGTDLICVIVGYFMKATMGIGTIITAFFMGPLIAYFRKTITEPLLAKYKDEPIVE